MTAPVPDDLARFLDEPRDSREYRRALAVTMALQGYMVEFVADILQVSPGFVSQAKKAYQTAGVAGFQLEYLGNQPYLAEDERQAVISWIQAQTEWFIAQIAQYIEETHGIVFQSQQSYYQLLSEAKISYKRAQSVHKHGNSERIAAKKRDPGSPDRKSR
jgi:putative transposase